MKTEYEVAECKDHPGSYRVEATNRTEPLPMKRELIEDGSGDYIGPNEIGAGDLVLMHPGGVTKIADAETKNVTSFAGK